MDPLLPALEKSIKQLPNVLGCVVLTDAAGVPYEVQAFVRTGADRTALRELITEKIQISGLADRLRDVFVFELEAESHFGDRESLARAAEMAEQEARMRGPSPHGDDRPGSAPARARPATEGRPAGGPLGSRPPLQKVVFTTSRFSSEAEVALGTDEAPVVGRADGERTPQGLQVLAQATLEAVKKLVPETTFRVVEASVVRVKEHEAVLVLVEEAGLTMVGASLLRGGPLPEAAVRATLDAVNRRLWR